MAKRFSETKIWEDDWYQSLPIRWKIVWKYLCDKCDEAGIWKPNFRLADFQIGEKIKWVEAPEWLNNGKIRIVCTDNAWIIKDFVPFQYGEAVYTSEHGFHKKIRNMLSKYPIDTLCHRVQEEEEVKEEVNKGGVGGFDTKLSNGEVTVKKPLTMLSDEDFLKNLQKTYTWVDINQELIRMDGWLLTHPGRKKTRRFIVNWLNKVEKPYEQQNTPAPRA